MPVYRPTIAERLQALELLDGAAVVALGLGLIAEQQGPGIGALRHAVEARSQGEVAVLSAGDFDVAVAGQLGAHGSEGVIAVIDGHIHAGGEEPGFQARRAEEGMLGQGDALDGEQFLGIGGVVIGHEVVFEAGDLVEIFEADDGERGSGEAVLAGVLCAEGFTLDGAGSGGAGRVGAVGRKLFFGRGFAWHGSSPEE